MGKLSTKYDKSTDVERALDKGVAAHDNIVSSITDNDKNSTVHYPSNKAVTEIADEIKEDLSNYIKKPITPIITWYNKSLAKGTYLNLRISDSNKRLSNLSQLPELYVKQGETISIKLLDNSTYKYAYALCHKVGNDIIMYQDTWSYLQQDIEITSAYDCFLCVMLARTDDGEISINESSNILISKVDISYIDIIKEAKAKSKWNNKKVAFIGDSITQGVNTTVGNRYCDFLNNAIGFSNMYVDGVVGSCWSSTSDYGTTVQPIINRYANIPTDRDLVVIFAGTNDFGHGSNLGSIDDTTDVSMCGAMYVVINGILTANPDVRLAVVTPLHRVRGNFIGEDEANAKNLKLQDYVNAIKSMCAKFSIPVIDMNEKYGLTPRINAVYSNYITDGLHPNANGHKLLADRMQPIIEQL